jgi:hypothetical protein
MMLPLVQDVRDVRIYPKTGRGARRGVPRDERAAVGSAEFDWYLLTVYSTDVYGNAGRNAALGATWDDWPATLVFDASASQARISSESATSQ